jgi:diguanylate cyclase (GGDEF)-like protein
MYDLQTMFRQVLPKRIEALEAAKQALHNRADDASFTIRRLAHSLRGSGGTYGFPEVSEAAGRVEDAPDPEILPSIDLLVSVLQKVAAGGDAPPAGVLLVEDDAVEALRLREMLEAKDREVAVVGTAADAVRIFGEREIACVVLDLDLPDGNGHGLVRRLREHPQGTNVPILVFAGVGDSRAKAECLALGADAILDKPLDAEILSLAVSSRIRRSIRQARDARVDPLTGLENRKAFEEAFRRAISTARRVRFPVAMAVLGVDHLKVLNDTHGIGTGDEVLKRIADTLINILRTSDAVARWGGDEFVALFADADLSGAVVALERVRRALREIRLRTPTGESFPVTLTCGLVQVGDGETPETVYARAERLLRLGKAAGRNRVFTERDVERPRRPKVLVVEDDELVVTLLRKHLEMDGFEVIHEPDGIAALTTSRSLEVSLVLLDRRMPGMDGIDLIAQLRRQASYARVPVVMLTALGSEEEIVRGFERGADDYIVKPFSPAELLARIHRLLRVGAA